MTPRPSWQHRAVALAAMVLALGAVAVPTSAVAEVSTQISFVDKSQVAVEFAENWVFQLRVEANYSSSNLSGTDGTVDVYLSGISGAYASQLRIQADGSVYFSQPESKPLLPAGDYQISAVFTPAPGSEYAPAQTAEPVELVISAREVQPRVKVSDDPSVSPVPVITASLSGDFGEDGSQSPAGTWHFAIENAEGNPVFELDVAQAQGATEPVRIETTDKLAKGTTFSVTSTFTPAAELKDGYAVAEASDVKFTRTGYSVGELVTAPVAMPIWLVIVFGLVVVGLVGAAVLMRLRLRARTPALVEPVEASSK